MTEDETRAHLRAAGEAQQKIAALETSIAQLIREAATHPERLTALVREEKDTADELARLKVLAAKHLLAAAAADPAGGSV